MAKFDTSGLQDLVNDLRKLGGEDADRAARAMTAAAAQEIADAWKESAEKHELRDTGAMIESIGFPDGVQNGGGVFMADVYPQGKDASGTRNAEKAFILHYGSSRLKPTYWVDEAVKAAEEPVQKRLQEIWDSFLQTGQVPDIPVQSKKSKRPGTRKKRI